jgi:hypothetical protein
MSQPLERPALSRDWIAWEITPFGGASTVTVSGAEIAVTAEDAAPAVSGNAGWNAAVVTNNSTAVVTAALMVGPGGTVDPGAAGRWRVWLRFTDGSRRPVEVGALNLT